MHNDRISVIEAAKQIGYGKQGVFKLLKRLGIETAKSHSPEYNGQAIAYISMDDFTRLQNDVAVRSTSESDTDTNDTTLGDSGFFYLIQLEPEHDPGRFKLGFANNVGERLRSHRCSAPFATLVKSWPCKRVWERTAIDCVTQNCEQLHTEVFRTDSIDDVIAYCDRFFDLMPELVEVDAET